VGRSRDVALTFYEDVLPLRLPERAASPNGAVQLTPLVERAGFLGDLHAKTFAAQGDHDAPNYPTAWLPTTRVAAAWQAMMTEKPFEP
jgi:hypothetical protein